MGRLCMDGTGLGVQRNHVILALRTFCVRGWAPCGRHGGGPGTGALAGPHDMWPSSRRDVNTRRLTGRDTPADRQGYPLPGSCHL